MKKYANYGGWAGLGLVLLGLIIYSINLVMGIVNWILIIAGALLIIAFFILRFKEIKTGLTSRSAKFGTNAAFMILFILGSLIVVNILLSRFSYRSDLTSAGIFSLAKQTKQVLKSLDRDVNVIGFFKSGEEAGAEELMMEYAHFSPKFKYEFVDPDKKPGLTKSYNVTSYGTIVVESQGKQEKITKLSEEELTNAIITVTRDGVKKIYWTTLHGERSFEDTGETGLATAKTAITDENYETGAINWVLGAQDSIPKDCSVLIIADPKTDLFDPEKKEIERFINSGGKALFMLDTDSPASYSALLAQWGFKVGNDLVVDASGIGQLFGAGPTIPIVSQYADHTITKDFGVMTFFPQARSITQEEDNKSGFNFTALASTSPQSWAETSPITTDRISFDEGQDMKGPISVMAVAEKSIPGKPNAEGETGNLEARIAVTGDADFASNSYINVQGNKDLFLNTVSWLAKEEDLISVRPRDPEDRRLNLTQQQSRLILYLGVILLPFLIFVTGIVVYVRRK